MYYVLCDVEQKLRVNKTSFMHFFTVSCYILYNSGIGSIIITSYHLLVCKTSFELRFDVMIRNIAYTLSYTTYVHSIFQFDLLGCTLFKFCEYQRTVFKKIAQKLLWAKYQQKLRVEKLHHLENFITIENIENPAIPENSEFGNTLTSRSLFNGKFQNNIT